MGAAWLHGGMSFQLLDQQRAFVEACARPHGAVLALGGPGVGKTTALVEAVAQRVEAGAHMDRLVVLTWSRPAAQRLRARIVARLASSQLAPVITTVPGWCLALQRRFGHLDADGQLPHVLTGPEQQMQVRELVVQLGRDLWPESVRAAIATMAFSQELRTGMARARQQGLDPDDLVRLGRRTGREEWVSMGLFFENYLDVLDAQPAWDYAELVHRTRLLLLEAPVSSVLTEEIEGVFCDEFAELDRSQIALLEQVHQVGIPVAATADPQSSVFAFRGADPRAVADFGRRFEVTGLPGPERIDLSTSLRGTAGLQRGIASLIARNPVAGGGSGTRPHEAGAVSGADRAEQIVCRSYETAAAEIAGVAEDLRTARLAGVMWSQQAVICRAGRGQLGTIARGLANQGIPVEVAGSDIALSEQACVVTLMDALAVALGFSRRVPPDPDQLDRLLLSPLTSLDPTALRRVGGALWHEAASGTTSDPMTLVRQFLMRRAGDHLPSPVVPPATAQDVGALVHRPDTSGAAPTDVTTPPTGPTAQTATSALPTDPDLEPVRELAALLGDAAARIMRGEGAYDVLWRLWDGTDWPSRLRGEALSGSASSGQANSDLDAVLALFDVAARHMELTGQKGAETLIAEVSGQEIPGDQARESDPRGRGVQVLTAHRAKGLEWDRVIIMGAAEGSWPGNRRGAGLLSAELLDADDPGLAPAPGAWMQQERRAFVLAASRARKELVITANLGSGDEQAQASRFVRELGGQVLAVPHDTRRPRSLQGLVGELRRVTADQRSTAGLREAAAHQLGQLAVVRDDQQRALVPGADPRSWWGLGGLSGRHGTPSPAGVGEPEGPTRDKAIRLSVTGLQKLIACPRQWFLDVAARGATTGGFAAGVGSVIHLLAEHAVTDHLSEDQLHDALDEAWNDLDVHQQGWRTLIERSRAHEMITRFERWQGGQPTEVLGVEVPVRHTFVIGGQPLELVGSIDRLERDRTSGRIRIIDFKTGSRAPSRTEAASNLQLAAYQLAVMRGACRELTGSTPAMDGALLVFLRLPAGARDPLLLKVVGQPGLDDHPYPAAEQLANTWLVRGDVDIQGPTMVDDALAFAVHCVVEEDYPAVEGPPCSYCDHRADCPIWAREASSR